MHMCTCIHVCVPVCLCTYCMCLCVCVCTVCVCVCVCACVNCKTEVTISTCNNHYNNVYYSHDNVHLYTIMCMDHDTLFT